MAEQNSEALAELRGTIDDAEELAAAFEPSERVDRLRASLEALRSAIAKDHFDARSALQAFAAGILFEELTSELDGEVFGPQPSH